MSGSRTGPVLAGRWPLPGGEGVRDALLAAYDAPGRGYHDLLHLAEVLDRLDDLAAAGERFADRPVRLAAWFHDAVYDGGPGAEERSAQWAEQVLPGLDVPAGEVAEVARLVRLTETHHVPTGDRDAAALCDADLAILASGPARYSAYLAGVRREYAHLDDATFAAGRSAVLRDLLAGASLFHTAYGLEVWEAPARANLARELGD